MTALHMTALRPGRTSSPRRIPVRAREHEGWSQPGLYAALIAERPLPA